MTRIVVNGCFDILHIGHLNLLRYAKSYPNSYVYVLIDSDSRIRKIKGKPRPIHNEYERCSLLFNLKSVDRVDVFDTEEEFVGLVEKFKPDIMIKGDDYKHKTILGEEYCKEIIFYPRMEKYSTTNVIERIIEHYARH